MIHQTFLVELDGEKFILQGFNSNVFKFPQRIENNLGLLNDLGDLMQLPFHLPLPIRNRDGHTMTSFEGQVFRLFVFVGGQTLQQITEDNQARLAAEAYATFASWAADFPLDQFKETIPDFHRLDLRYNRLLAVAKQVKDLNPEEIQIRDFYLGQKELIDKYLSAIEEIPVRLTHNDTKINNLIFSDDLEKVNAIIDLDTIMPGYLLYDFGDLVRTVASREEEISQDWESQELISALFEKLLEGYWQGAGDLMSSKEAISLLLGGEVMCALMGIRFFTDHLEGNVYYQVAYPEQNFHRAKNQMILLQSMQQMRPQLERIFNKITGIQIDS